MTWAAYVLFAAAILVALVLMAIGLMVPGKEGYAAAGALSAAIIVGTPVLLGWVA